METSDEQSQQIPAADKYKFITTNVDTKAFLQFISAIQTISSAEVVCSKLSLEGADPLEPLLILRYSARPYCSHVRQ